jgi:hypothetical protein
VFKNIQSADGRWCEIIRLDLDRKWILAVWQVLPLLLPALTLLPPLPLLPQALWSLLPLAACCSLLAARRRRSRSRDC